MNKMLKRRNLFVAVLLLTVYYACSVKSAYANDVNTSPQLLAKNDGIIIFKEDIIISSDELRKEKNRKNTVSSPGKTKKEKRKPFKFGIINKYLEEGKKYEARNYLSDIFLNNKIPEKQDEIKELLDELNKELIFSSMPSKDATIYTVKAGDTLSRIAKQFNTNYELIMKINDKTNTRINIGEKLKVITGNTKIIIDKSEFTLKLLLNGHYVKQYRIGTGKNNKTPVGTFEVKDKIKNPTWYSPHGGVYPFGHEKNILGTRWIGFKEKENLSGFGIHGTTLPETIGTASSDGCIRMVNSEVEELYDFVTMDTQIVIKE